MNLVVKLVIFSILGNKLKVLLIKDKLPSEKLEKSKLLDSKAKKIFEGTIGIKLGGSYIEQLYTVEREGNINIVYYALRHIDNIPLSRLQSFIHVGKISEKIEDNTIIKYAVQRLRWKIEYTNVVYSLLPNEFTFNQLQSTYEAILGEMLDKRNFRKKILLLGILKETGHIKKLGKARPAEMFSFKDKKLTFVKIL